MGRQTFKLNGCQSPNPKPEIRVCPIGDCGIVIPETHWCCRDHFTRFPMRFRLFANQFKGFWAGDPHYDRFIELANELDSRVSRSSEELLSNVQKAADDIEKDYDVSRGY